MRVYTQNQFLYRICMLVTKIISGTYSSIKKTIKFTYNFFFDLPNLYRQQSLKIKDYFADIKYKLNNLAKVNLELGVYHLYKYNLNDAIIRFKLVDKFFKPGDLEANYWLGWTYFLKNNTNKAIHHLKEAVDEDKLGLMSFIKDTNNVSEIPEKIQQQYRDIIAIKWHYNTDFGSKKIYHPLQFIQRTLEQITYLPDNYRILEIGCNTGLIGAEIVKRFPDNLELIGIETSSKMIDIIRINEQEQNKRIYDQLLHSSLQNFIDNYSHLTANKFDIVVSFCGLNFTKTLDHYLAYIYSILNDLGYLAIYLPIGAKTLYSNEIKEFKLSVENVENYAIRNGLNLLFNEKLMLGINNKYSIFIFNKNKHK